jgi:putative hydrolase of the HAD superfamily
MKSKIALILDFGGVISRTLFETHALTERALGLSAGSLTWQGPFAPESDELWTAMQNDEISERDYWAQRAREVGQLLGQHWTEMSESVVRPEALDAIGVARKQGAKLAILSNELDLFYGSEFRSKLPFLNQFDVIADATYTNTLKPDPRAYLDCAGELGVDVENCVFVDDQQRNVAGAEAVGMKSVKFDVREPGKSFEKVLSLLEALTKEPEHA